MRTIFRNIYLSVFFVACGHQANQSPTVMNPKPDIEESTQAASSKPAEPKAILAVFGVEVSGINMPQVALERLSDYLAVLLAESGSFKVVPRDQIRSRLGQQKVDSYRSCYDQACQIEIGRELAAEKTLSPKIIRIGDRCSVTMVVYDLRTSTTDLASRQIGGCDENDLADMFVPVVAKIAGKNPEDFTNTRPSSDMGDTGWPQQAGAPTKPLSTKKSVTLECPDCVIDDEYNNDRYRRYYEKPRTPPPSRIRYYRKK